MERKDYNSLDLHECDYEREPGVVLACFWNFVWKGIFPCVTPDTGIVTV